MDLRMKLMNRIYYVLSNEQIENEIKKITDFHWTCPRTESWAEANEWMMNSCTAEEVFLAFYERSVDIPSLIKYTIYKTLKTFQNSVVINDWPFPKV